MSILETTAVVVSFLGIWLTAKRRMLCWPVSLLACALYFRIFLDVRLYADMALQILFGLAILYGWIMWARGRQNGEVAIMPVSPQQVALGLTVAAVGAVTIGWCMHRFTDASLPWLDAALSSFSLLAQYWTARRHVASWFLWIFVDIIYAGMFAFKDLWLTAGLYAAMSVLAVQGYRHWRSVGH